MKKRDQKSVTIYLPEKLYLTLRSDAWSEHRSMTKQAELIIQKYYALSAKKAPTPTSNQTPEQLGQDTVEAGYKDYDK